MHRKEKGRVFI